mmetsp:Transcript_9355/g.39317  ORF Transcript_9355/g.39317 Transcript_9355/m.39317 type:complete len:246 (-) Transcript_9355:435-1172(-)
MPRTDAPRDATSAWSTSHLAASSSPHASRGVGASFPRDAHALSAAASAAAGMPAPHATNGVSVHPGSPSPCAPLELMPWSAVNRNVVPPSSSPANRLSNAATRRRTPSSTVLTFFAYASPKGLCAWPALSSPSRCSRKTTRSPSNASRSESRVAPLASSSAETCPSRISIVRSNTHSSSAAWSLDAAKSSSSSAYMRCRTCSMPFANKGTTEGAPIAHAAEDWFSRWSNSTALACHPFVMALGSS